MFSIVKLSDIFLKNNSNSNVFFGLGKIRGLSIEKRLQLKPYLLTLGFSMYLIAVAILVKNYTSLTGIVKFTATDSIFFAISYFGGAYLFLAYFTIYRQDERAVFLLRRFLRNTNICYNGSKIRMNDFESGLKAYQKTLPPSYWLLNLEAKVKQLQFVLDRGTKDDITKAQMHLQSLTNAIVLKDPTLFDQAFSKFNSFLVEKEAEKRRLFLQISNFPSQGRWQNTVRRMALNSIEKVMPYIIFFTFIAIVYVIFNLKLPWI